MNSGPIKVNAREERVNERVNLVFRMTEIERHQPDRPDEITFVEPLMLAAT
jgi:hypothetical protein